MYFKIFLFLLLLGFDPAFGESTAADDALQTRFLAEAPKAWEQYLERIKNVNLEAHLTFRKRNIGGIAKSDATLFYEIKLTDGRMLDVRLESKNDVYTNRPANHPQSESSQSGSVDCVTPGYAYSLRKEDSQAWRILRLLDRSDELKQFIERDALGMSRFALLVDSELAPALIADKDFTIDKAEMVPDKSRAVCRITFRRPRGTEMRGVVGGFVDFDCDHYWLILRYAVRDKDSLEDKIGKNTVSNENTFRDEVNGERLPLLKRNVITYSYTDGRPLDATTTGEFTKFELREVPATEFDMANFGVHTSLASSLSTFWRAVLYAANGIVFLAVAVWLYRRYQNARRAAA
ncbi:MAG TPA: hypothetical protein VFE24_12995 [Pirellulales bacterium]|jgi:hypothetical protein|nr:hypothetical protein [Pirellulales bacterium]